MKLTSTKVLCLCLLFVSCINLQAQEKPAESAKELADKLANPVASLISVPLQNNVDYGIGAHNGSKYTLNFQPVIPIGLGPNLNLITRYVVPIVDQYDITGEHSHQFGLSDATVSAFFAPVKSKNGVSWGAGPAFLIPTGTDDFLSTNKWCIGPTALILRQAKGVTYGFLVNQLWSFAGEENGSKVNQMFLQPFLSHNWKSGASLGVNSEITFNWEAGTTTAFLNPTVSGITKLGKQTISIVIGPRIPLGGPGKPDFGLRAGLTFVFTE